jgi:ATP-dependent DNA helicase DinG
VLAFDFKRHFPHPNVRKEQDASIQFALDAFINQNKRFVILELGTGCGKSAIGMTVARYLNEARVDDVEFGPGAYILTTQKILQEQYMNDFGPPNGGLMSIKSSSNYRCEFHTENTCGESLRLVKNEPRGTPFWNKCMNGCIYKREKQRFLDAAEGTTNYSYFMAETMYGGKITPRDLLVLDEAHNCELELSKFIEVVISEKFSHETLKLPWPKTDSAPGVVEWLRRDYEPRLAAHLARIQAGVQQFHLEEKLDEFKAISMQIDLLDKHICKLHRFLSMWSDDNWIMNVVAPETDRSMRKFEFKPVDVGPYSDEILFRFGKRVLMMSATIVNRDVFCETLGIDPEQVAFLSIDSPFPIENRPICYAPVGAMAQATLDKSLPGLAEMVKLILEQHKGQKGIIHTHTFKIANYLKKHVRSNRLIVHDSLNREDAIEKHMSSPKATVLVSPSLAEGIDLKDDLSRFQIICKMPYPYLGDKLVKKRMAKHRSWYAYQTAKTIVQSAGRSVRNETDHAVTYILDGNWENFYSQNWAMFPASFRKAIKT